MQVRVFAMNSTEAQGPHLARARAGQQYDGQDYWLQIDAHSRCEGHPAALQAGKSVVARLSIF